MSQNQWDYTHAFQISEAPLDYTSTSRQIGFEAGVRERCIDVAIIDDRVHEGNEFFIVTLMRTDNLDDRIRLDPAEGVVIIIDNDI